MEFYFLILSRSLLSTSDNKKNTENITELSENFKRGSIIQLENGEYRNVENMQTDDFIKSASCSNYEITIITVKEIFTINSNNIITITFLSKDKLVSIYMRAVAIRSLIDRNK